VRAEIVKAKLQYKRKIESKFSESDLRSVWNGIKLMIGLHKGTRTVSLNGFDSNELNIFYMRFSNSDLNEKMGHMGDNLVSDCILDFDINVSEVKAALCRISICVKL